MRSYDINVQNRLFLKYVSYDDMKLAFSFVQQMLLIIKITMSSNICLSVFGHGIKINRITRFKVNPFSIYGRFFPAHQNSTKVDDKSSEGPRRTYFGFSWLIGVAVGATLWGCMDHNKLFVYSESKNSRRKSTQCM